jgi:hypothetical protein
MSQETPTPSKSSVKVAGDVTETPTPSKSSVKVAGDVTETPTPSKSSVKRRLGTSLNRRTTRQPQSLSACRREMMWSICSGDYDTNDSVFRTAAQYIEERVIGLPRPEYEGACILLQIAEWAKILGSYQKSPQWTENKCLAYEQLCNQLSIEDTKVRTCFICCHFV